MHRLRLTGNNAVCPALPRTGEPFSRPSLAQAQVQESDWAVVVEVAVCPAIHHLRAHQREIVPCFCQQCYFLNEAIAAQAGFTVRVTGGNGSCRQSFQARDGRELPQDLNEIREVTC